MARQTDFESLPTAKCSGPTTYAHLHILMLFARFDIANEHEAMDRWATDALGVSPNTSVDKLEEAFHSKFHAILSDTPILKRLAELQRKLDALDREGLAKLHEIAPPSQLIDPTLTEWSSFVDRFISDDDQKTRADTRYYTLAYMLSATFKDCSFFITLSDAPSVKLVDLDPKSVKKFAYWEKLDAEIVETYARLEPIKRKHCIDGLV